MGGDLDKNADFQEIEFGLISFMRKSMIHFLLGEYQSLRRRYQSLPASKR